MMNDSLIHYGVLFTDESDSLEHYGVLGMKWGVRKDKDKKSKKSKNKFPDRMVDYNSEVKEKNYKKEKTKWDKRKDFYEKLYNKGTRLTDEVENTIIKDLESDKSIDPVVKDYYIGKFRAMMALQQLEYKYGMELIDINKNDPNRAKTINKQIMNMAQKEFEIMRKVR